MKWQLLSSGARSSQRGEGGRGRGSWRWEGEGAPPWSPCHEKLWDQKVAEAEEEEVLGPAEKGPRPVGPKLSSALQRGATTSYATEQHSPFLLRQEVAGYFRVPPLLSPTMSPPHFLLPLPCPQRARGSCSPLPHPSPQGSGSMATATQTRRRLSASFISDIINHRSPRQHP